MMWSLIVISTLAILKPSTCFPNLEAIRIPEVEVLSPSEVNNLGNEPHKRSINFAPPAQNDIEATIKQVQDMIRANPSLPRLTRGEILDIIENITKTDMEKAKQNFKNIRDPKAIMVVMPYTPSNLNDDPKNMEDLFTKPPVTHIIGAEPFTKQQNSISNKNKPRRKPSEGNNINNLESSSYSQRTRSDLKKVPFQETTASTTKTSEYRRTTSITTTTEAPLTVSTTRKLYKRVRSTTSPTQKTTEYTTSATTTRSRRRRPPVTTEKPDTPATTYHPRSRRPLRRRTTTSTVSTITTKYPNHKYPDESEEINFDISKETNLPSDGIVVVTPPQLFYPGDINSGFYDLAVQENRRDEVFVKKDAPKPDELFAPASERVTSSTPKLSTTKETIIEERLTPVAEKLTSYATTPATQTFSPKEAVTKTALAEKINIPEHLHNVVKDMRLEPSLIDIPENYHKKFEATTHAPSKEEKERIQNLLESLGLATPKTTPPPTTTAIPDVSNVADSLTPEMRELLMSFGLIPNPNEDTQKEEKITYNPEKAEVDPASYIGFKPLPDDGESRDEMESLLASFGLGRSSRRQKALNIQHKNQQSNRRYNELNFDAVPDAYKDVIRDIGFDESNRKIDMGSSENNIESESQKIEEENYQEDENSEEEYATPEELEKLEKLMSIIKQLEGLNRNVTEDDLKNVDLSGLRELVGSLNNASNNDDDTDKFVTLDERPAPNPINYDYSPSKNEVKRQELTLSGNVSIVTPTVVSTTEESRSPNLADLESSFGGGASAAQTASSTTTEAPTTTTTVRTGFYYLVDWNTFLDIDDQKGKRVNLRLQPTVGDPKRWLSVSVP